MKELTLFTLLSLMAALAMIALTAYCEKTQNKDRTEARP